MIAFLKNAPNDALYTQMKVVAIISINGLLRLNEIVAFDWENISVGSIQEGTETKRIIQASLIRSKRTGPKTAKKFIISDDLSVEILSRYMESFEVKSGRFFRKLKNDLKPAQQPIGQNTISSYPQKIAEFLQLPESDKFSSHSIRHSGATILSDDGATILQLQQAGGWESSAIAQSYVEEGTHSRLQIARRFQESNSISASSAKVQRTRYTSSSSSGQFDNIPQHFPSISIGSGSYNQVHITIGCPPTLASSESPEDHKDE